MTENERSDEQVEARQEEEVEGHGAKQIAAAGLAGAALIGAGAVGVKMATDDDPQRNVGALTERQAAIDLRKADLDGDGFLSYRELAEYNDLVQCCIKLNVAQLNKEGIGVTAEGLLAAGYQVPLKVIDKVEGFAVEGEEIMLKQGPDRNLDALLKGSALEWSSKHREVDPDLDGYAEINDLERAGMKMDFSKLREQGHDVSAEALEKAMVKIEFPALGEDGFATEGDVVILSEGVSQKLDEYLKKEAGG